MSGECITCGASASGERCEACAYVEVWDSCPDCDGRGRWVRYRGPMREESGLCEACEGTGLVLVELFGKDAIRASH